MNKGLQIFLSLLLIIIAGGLIYSGSRISNNNLVEQETVNNQEEKMEEINKEVDNQTITMDTKTQGVILKTNQGDIKLELFADKAPKTVENFVKLASEGFYDGVRFHRVIKDFMIQSGDPLTKDLNQKMYWGTGDPGYKFADEFGDGLSNVAGTISMANSGPNTNGSQFFINVGDNTFLDGKHAVFGKVIEGMDVVTKIENTATGQNDQPVEDMIIEKVEVIK